MATYEKNDSLGGYDLAAYGWNMEYWVHLRKSDSKLKRFFCFCLPHTMGMGRLSSEIQILKINYYGLTLMLYSWKYHDLKVSFCKKVNFLIVFGFY